MVDGSRNEIVEEIQLNYTFRSDPSVAFKGSAQRALCTLGDRGLFHLLGEIICTWASIECNLWKCLPDGVDSEGSPHKNDRPRWSSDLKCIEKLSRKGSIDIPRCLVDRLVALDCKYTKIRHGIAHGAISISHRSRTVYRRVESGVGYEVTDRVDIPAGITLDSAQVEIDLDEETLQAAVKGFREMLDILDRVQTIANAHNLHREWESSE